MEEIGGFLEAVAADEPHGVVGAAVGVGTQAVDRDDSGVLQAAGDLGLDEEAGAAGRVVGVPVQDLFEGDLAVQFGVERNEDRPESALGMWPENAKPLSLGGEAGGVASGAVGVILPIHGRGVAGGGIAERLVDIRVAQVCQVFTGGPAGRDGGEARCDIATVGLDVQLGQGLNIRPLCGVEIAQSDQVVGERPRLVTGPRVKGGDELRRLDQAVLEGEESEEKVVFGGHEALCGGTAAFRQFPTVGVTRSSFQRPYGLYGKSGSAASACGPSPQSVERHCNARRSRVPCSNARAAIYPTGNQGNSC